MTNGWQTVQLGDVLQRVKTELVIDDSVTYKQVTVRLWNKGVILRGEQEGIAIKTKRQFFVKAGQLLMSRIDVRNGAIGLVPKELDGAIVSNDFWVYDFDESKLFPRFLAHYVATPGFIEDADRTSSGTTKRIRAEETAFLNINIPLPSLDEQRRIVERVEALAARIAKAQSLREEANREAKSLLNSILSKITKDLLETHEPQLLEEITLFIGDMNHDMPKGQEKGIPFISPKDFASNSKIDFDHAKKISREDFERLSKKACPQQGDILMARYGTIGAARYVDTAREFLASYSIAVIRPNPELVDGRFLYWMSISPYVQEQAIKGIRGSGMADLGLKTIRQFIIPHLNFDEQRRIVAYLDSVQAQLASLRELQSASGEELDALLPSVLDRAFKGEL